MINIYWATFPENNLDVSELKYFPPESILKDTNVREFFGPAAMCPSILDDARNTFKIQAPIDFNITFDQNFVNFTSEYPYSAEFINHYIGQINDAKVFQLSAPTYLFFCDDEELIMNCLHPYYEDTEFTKNCVQVSASYDICNWFRTVKPCFKLKQNKYNINISRGDVLTYIKFNTYDKVNLQQFDGSVFDNSNILPGTMGYKRNKKSPFVPTKLLENYEAFRRAKYKKRILKLIRENLL